MRHPIATAVPVVLLLLVLIVPFAGIKFGGISESYLPPGNESRQAQESFDKAFPAQRTEEIKLVIAYDANDQELTGKLRSIADQANAIPGFTKKFNAEGDKTGQYGENGPAVLEMSAGLVDRTTAAEAIKDLRAIDTRVCRCGWPNAHPHPGLDGCADEQAAADDGAAGADHRPADVPGVRIADPADQGGADDRARSGRHLGILTWIFVDGHGSDIANFTRDRCSRRCSC